MLILAFKPDHDGAVAVIRDRELLFSVEPEKDSFRRHSGLTPSVMLGVAERTGELPDVVALGGWHVQHTLVGAGYYGPYGLDAGKKRFFGKDVEYFSSTHERSHIMMAVGMAPRDDFGKRAVLNYEGNVGSAYLLDDSFNVLEQFEIMKQPGGRYGFLFALADPTFPEAAAAPRLEDSGKLMALAAYGDPREADSEVRDTVDRIMAQPTQRFWKGGLKREFRDSPIHNAGVEAEVTKVAAAMLTNRIFELFAEAARNLLPKGIPLHISGGCGLNCDWNVRWRDLGHFSSVFVPPCTDDSGSAIGTGIDALVTYTGDPYIDWNVYSGLEFVWDEEPPPERWVRQPRDDRALAEALGAGRIVAWVQDRWEIGPRALGNRSLLAEPFNKATRDRLNEVKLREGYRPVAPVCRLEDSGALFDDESHDPYMLYFRRFLDHRCEAVRHVDGSARCQTVTPESNRRLHDLLSAFAQRHGVGILCNTSLNFPGLGFINRMSQLTRYCEGRGISDMVVEDSWYVRRRGSKGPPVEEAAPPTRI